MKKLIAFFAMATAIVLPVSAHATAIGTSEVFTLTTSDPASGIGNGDFGTITLTQTSSSLVTVVEDLNGTAFVGTGAGDSLGFNLTGVSSPVVTLSATDATLFTVNGSRADNPFGTFAINIACDNPATCHGGSVTFPGPLDFTVSATSIDITDFTATTSSYGNVYFASDVISNGNTGVVGAFAGTTKLGLTDPAPTPEPSSLLLLGTGLLGLAGFTYSRKVNGDIFN